MSSNQKSSRKRVFHSMILFIKLQCQLSIDQLLVAVGLFRAHR